MNIWPHVRVLLCVTAGSASAQEQLWIRQFGSSAGDPVTAVSPDNAGGCYSAGTTFGNLVSPVLGQGDRWIARHDDEGNLLWIRQFGMAWLDYAYALAPDAAGGAYVAGTQNTGSGSYNGWLARYTPEGNQLWIRLFGPMTFNETMEVNGLAADDTGGVYVAGATTGNYGGPVIGGWDAVVVRYTPSGTVAWSRRLGTISDDSSRSACPDGAGGLCVAGVTGGDFGAPNAGASDAWLARLDGAGNQLWVRQLGTPTLDGAITTAESGGFLYVGGWTNGSLAAPYAGGTVFPGGDAWVARYDRDGNQLWVVQFGTGADEMTASLAPDGRGGAFAGGGTGGALFGPLLGSSDAWVARFAPDGSLSWSLQFGTTSDDGGSALAPAGSGGFFVAGLTSGNLAAVNAGASDAWVGRFIEPCYPDCNADGQLAVADFGCFQTKFVAADPYADCNADGQRTVADFGCFQTRFVGGCP